MTTRDIDFKTADKYHGLIPCLTPRQLTSFGVNTSAIARINVIETDSCVPLTEMISDATTRFDTAKQRLSLTIPQIFMGGHARGHISPDLWDHGINAGLLNYNLTGNNVRNKNSGNNNYAYLNLQSGLNIGAWRLRDNTTWSYSRASSHYSAGENKWQHINTWLERDVISLRSRLTLGDSYTNGDVFDGINFRGAQLASDDNMLPDSQRGFAPAIHGIARGTAQVSIKQNGYEIYQSTVPPGPFTITDLYAAGNGGDLRVKIQEADGRSQVFSVPYASVPILQREGHTRYAVTVGEYRSGNDRQDNLSFFQSTVMQGLPAGWTVYGGTQLASRYRAFNLGIGKNLGKLGAISLDATQAKATLSDDSEHQGQSLRFLYNKTFNELGTNIQLIGYRYSTHGYYSLSDTTYKHITGFSVETPNGAIEVMPKFTHYYNLIHTKRDKLQLSINQQLGQIGTLYLNGSRQAYWGTDAIDKQLQIGLNSTIDDISWTLSYSLAKNVGQQRSDSILALNVNIPFSHWMRSDSRSIWRHTNTSLSMSNDLHGRTTHLAGLNGTLLENKNLNYSIQMGYRDGEHSNDGSTGYTALHYRGGYGNASVGYSHSRAIQQVYFGLNGGLVAHANGLTLSQPLNDTTVLVKVPGASHVRIENQTGVQTDWRGYAVVPYATEYRENRVALDTNTLADNVDLNDAVVSVIPTHGAIVLADFKARIGTKLLLSLVYNSKPVPFGAIVTSEDNPYGNIVDDNGQVYLSGMPLQGKIRAKWGENSNTSCTASYSLPPASHRQILSKLTVNCR